MPVTGESTTIVTDERYFVPEALLSHPVRSASAVAGVLLLTAVAFTNPSRASANAVVVELTTCKVTRPNGRGTLLEAMSPDLHGNGLISTGLWPDGTIVFRPGGPGSVYADGSLAMKWGWRRAVRGQLRIDGRRLDEPAPSLRADIPAGYGDFGFQSSALIFPTPGCWEVTGRVGKATLTFVTLVRRIGEGPSTRATAALRLNEGSTAQTP
jgi:hypothetical protein